MINIGYGFSSEIIPHLNDGVRKSYCSHSFRQNASPKLPDQRASNKGHVRLDKQYEEAVYQKLCGEED